MREETGLEVDVGADGRGRFDRIVDSNDATDGCGYHFVG